MDQTRPESLTLSETLTRKHEKKFPNNPNIADQSTTSQLEKGTRNRIRRTILEQTHPQLPTESETFLEKNLKQISFGAKANIIKKSRPQGTLRFKPKKNPRETARDQAYPHFPTALETFLGNNERQPCEGLNRIGIRKKRPPLLPEPETSQGKKLPSVKKIKKMKAQNNCKSRNRVIQAPRC